MNTRLGLAGVACLVIGSVGFAAPLPKQSTVKKETSVEAIKKVLDSTVTLDFNATNLPAAIAQLTDEYKVNFILDKAIIQQMGVEPNELQVDFRAKDVKLRNGLRNMLGQFNLTFAIVGDAVIVTTEEVAVYKQLKHRVSVDFNAVTFSTAIMDMAKANAVNVVLDPRIVKSKATETLVTLSLDDVPFETAVRLMSEMASVKPVRMGNVLLITTDERAEKLRDTESLVPHPNQGGGGVIVPGGGGVNPGVVPCNPGNGRAVPQPAIELPAVPPGVDK